MPEAWWSDAQAKGEGHILPEAREHFRSPGPYGHEDLVRTLEFASNLRQLGAFPRILRGGERRKDEHVRDELLRRSLRSPGDYDGAELEAAIAAGYHQEVPGRIAAVSPGPNKAPDFRLDLEDGVVHLECKARATRVPYDRIVKRGLKELAEVLWPILARTEGSRSASIFCHREPRYMDPRLLAEALNTAS